MRLLRSEGGILAAPLLSERRRSFVLLAEPVAGARRSAPRGLSICMFSARVSRGGDRRRAAVVTRCRPLLDLAPCAHPPPLSLFSSPPADPDVSPLFSVESPTAH